MARAALRLRKLKQEEREHRLGFHTKWQPLTVLTWLRGAQRAVVKFERKYASYRNRTLTRNAGAVSCALPSDVEPGELP